jgi:hypothetical protein
VSYLNRDAIRSFAFLRIRWACSDREVARRLLRTEAERLRKGMQTLTLRETVAELQEAMGAANGTEVLARLALRATGPWGTRKGPEGSSVSAQDSESPFP